LITILASTSFWDPFKIPRSDLEFIYQILVSKEFEYISAFSICQACSKLYRIVKVPNERDFRLLRKLEMFSLYIQRQSIRPYVALFTVELGTVYNSKEIKAFQGMYKLVIEGMRPFIGSNTENILMLNAVALLNLSLEYYNFDDSRSIARQYIALQTPSHYSAVAILALGLPLHEFWRSNEHRKHSVLVVKISPEQFLYCVERDEREAFSILFWTVPLDTWSWTCLLTTCGLLTIQLRGQWFPVYSFLVRQSTAVLNQLF